MCYNVRRVVMEDEMNLVSIVLLGLAGLVAGWIGLLILGTVYARYWLRPIMLAWRVHQADWLSWHDIKKMSGTKSFHVLIVLYSFIHADAVTVRLRKPLTIAALVRHYGEVEAPGDNIGAAIFYEFKIIPGIRKRGRSKKNRRIAWLFPLPSLQPVKA